MLEKIGEQVVTIATEKDIKDLAKVWHKINAKRLEKIGAQVATLSTKNDIKDLTSVWRKLNTKRKDLDAEVKAWKKIEDYLAVILSNKLIVDETPSVKTTSGTFANKTTTTIKTADKEAFFRWLGENFEHVDHLLTAKPYSIPLMKREYEEEDLPPGLQLESFMKLSVTK